MSKYSIGRAIGRTIAREFAKFINRKWNFYRIQNEASQRPESVQVNAANGTFWLSPIEYRLYNEMLKNGLSPYLQYCVEGYFVDFAFPDVLLAVEADGAEYHSGDRAYRDRIRDAHIRRAGWTVMRFKGGTIYNRPSNCAYVIKREVENRRRIERERLRMIELRRQRRKEAIMSPLRKLLSLFNYKSR